MRNKRLKAVIILAIDLLILPFLLLLGGVCVVGTLVSSGLVFPTPLTFAVFVIMLSTVVYLGIGLIYGIISFWRIQRVPGVADLFAGQDRLSITMLLLQGAKVSMIQWPYFLIRRSK